MMYKFLPIVAVAAEEFMGRSLTTATTTAAPVITEQGSGYDVTNNLVKRKAHGYAADAELQYDLNSGTAQGGLTDGTIYFVKAKSTVDGNAANTVDAFVLMNKASTAADEADIDITDATKQTEPVTWTHLVTGTTLKDCGTKAVAGDANADPVVAAVDAVACAKAVAATTGANAVAAHSEFKVVGHGLANDDQVRYTCGTSDGTAAACIGGMAQGSHWFITKKAADNADDITLSATKTGAKLNLASDAANLSIVAAGTNHGFRKCGTAWKSITTTAKPAAGSSNFHAMVATVFSAFFYLMM